MSLSAALILAAAATAAPAGDTRPSRGVELAQARVRAEILAPAIVRQATGPEPAGNDRPRHQISRRGRTVLVEYQ